MTRTSGLRRVVSGDTPGSTLLSIMVGVILLALLLAPVLFPGFKSLSICANILIFIVLAASFDLLLGYTGVISFAHIVFFGLGAYGVGLAVVTMGPSWTSVLVGAILSVLASVVLATIVGLFSLRVRAIFFAMITLAVASSAYTIVLQMSAITGGEDGLIFRLPELVMPGEKTIDVGFTAFEVNGRTLLYYLIFFVSMVLFLCLLRIVNSPFGRVLLAIRENEFRSEAIGYRVVNFRVISNVFAAVFACLSGVLLSLWLRYTGPTATLSFELMLDLLIVVIVGGIALLSGSAWGEI